MAQLSQVSSEGTPTQLYMKPRALILDLFGDYLRYTGGEVKAGDLVTLLGVFDVEPATVRVTLSRLRRERWFTTRRLGRETIYVLSEHMLAVLDDGRARIFADYNEPWDHTWTTVVHQNGKPDRVTREQLRRQLSWLGFGPLSASTWLTPRERTEQVKSLAEEFPDFHFTLMRSHTGSDSQDRDLARRCWDLDHINDLYRHFLAENSRLSDKAHALRGPEALVVRTALIASYRHFPFMDPWLPAELWPTRWLGAEANALFRSVHRELGPESSNFVASVVRHPVDAPDL